MADNRRQLIKHFFSVCSYDLRYDSDSLTNDEAYQNMSETAQHNVKIIHTHKLTYMFIYIYMDKSIGPWPEDEKKQYMYICICFQTYSLS